MAKLLYSKINLLPVILLASLSLFVSCDDNGLELSGSHLDIDPPINDPVPNANGIYLPQDCSELGNSLELVGHLNLPNDLQDIWGYYDKERNREYALAGFHNDNGGGLYIINVTDPQNPNLTSTVTAAEAFDIKVWKNYIFTVNGHSGANGGIILDLSDPADPKTAGVFPTSHNIFISERGYLYRATSGVSIYNLVPDPGDPDQIWSDGRSGGHDIAVIGNTLFDFHGFDVTRIYDISNPYKPVLQKRLDNDIVRLHHSGWTSPNGQFLYINDELPSNLNQNPDITVWDLDSKSMVSTFRDTNSTVHNIYTLCDKAIVSYYTRGLVVFDVSNNDTLVVQDEFDTDPDVDGEGKFLGAWGVFPYTRSGNILVSDAKKGLYVFRLING